MKKIFKKLTTLLLAGALTLGLATSAFADTTTITYEGKQDGKDIFGFLIPASDYTDEYTTSDLFDGFKDVMPGDELTQTVTVTNNSNKSVELFMRAEVDDPTYNRDLAASEGKQDETVATMTDFLAQLSMKVYNGDKLIYGDTDANENWISPDQLDGLRENTSLGTIAAGKSIELTVHLLVPLDLDNDYANRVGEVDWVFTMEEKGGGDGPSGGDDNDTTSRTVTKVWQDNNSTNRPDSITVTLTGTDRQDNTVIEEETITLSTANNWTHTWTGLDSFYKWTVEEQNVPDGYEATYTTSQSGNVITITNSNSSGDTPGGNPPGGDTPDGSTPGGDPGDGTGDPDDPVFTSDLTVVKAWDDNNSTDRPDSVTLQLYDGATEVDTVTLTEADGWTYTWDDLAADGQWRVIEIDIPDGYTPVYSSANGVITITNAATLIDAGQMNWPVPVLGGLGILILASGIVLTQKKKDYAAE